MVYVITDPWLSNNVRSLIISEWGIRASKICDVESIRLKIITEFISGCKNWRQLVLMQMI